MSSFSTFGPVNDLYFKPSLAAPGGNILSTYPRAKGSYAILSGTSMAVSIRISSYLGPLTEPSFVRHLSSPVLLLSSSRFRVNPRAPILEPVIALKRLQELFSHPSPMVTHYKPLRKLVLVSSILHQ